MPMMYSFMRRRAVMTQFADRCCAASTHDDCNKRAVAKARDLIDARQ
jgi:hypothetical protein